MNNDLDQFAVILTLQNILTLEESQAYGLTPKHFVIRGARENLNFLQHIKNNYSNILQSSNKKNKNH